VADALARHPHAAVRRAVAGNPATSPALLAALLTGDGLPAVQRCLVCEQHRSLPPGETCGGTHRSAVRQIRYQALVHTAAPPQAVARFADHPSVTPRALVAAHEGLAQRTYARLAADPEPWVRREVARNPSVGKAVLRGLAEDRDHDVTRSLAHRPDVPLDLLARLARSTRTGPTLLPRVARADPMEVESLAAVADPALRMLVALRRDLPDGLRDALADDLDAKVVNAVAPHPGLGEARLLAMIDRHGHRVAAMVATNPDASPAVLERLAQGPSPARKALREIARHPNAPVAALLACLADRRARVEAAARPELPVDVLVGLLADADELVAAAAAANPSLPVGTMHALVP
jgi:hypothetical protein